MGLDRCIRVVHQVQALEAPELEREADPNRHILIDPGRATHAPGHLFADEGFPGMLLEALFVSSAVYFV